MVSRIFHRTLPSGEAWKDTVNFPEDWTEEQIIIKENIIFQRYLNYLARPVFVADGAIECTMQDNAFVEQCIQCTMHSESCVYKSRLQCKLHCVCCGPRVPFVAGKMTYCECACDS